MLYSLATLIYIYICVWQFHGSFHIKSTNVPRSSVSDFADIFTKGSIAILMDRSKVWVLWSKSGVDPGFWKGRGRGVWVINWQCAHRRCAPLGGLKACPLGTFEILDAFSCNLVHIFFLSHLSLFLPIFCRWKGGGRALPPPLDPRLQVVSEIWPFYCAWCASHFAWNLQPSYIGLFPVPHMCFVHFTHVPGQNIIECNFIWKEVVTVRQDNLLHIFPSYI